MGGPTLAYEPTDEARPIYVERDRDITRIVIAMHGLYVPVPRWVGDLDVLYLIIAPVWWITTLIVRTCLRLSNPPRAVLEVDGDRFRMSLRDSRTGEVTTFDWPRSAVSEARANRYSSGLWLDVPGHVKDTFFDDLPAESIERIESALKFALAEVPGSSNVSN